eukprot:767556-Hanusia_phi.AAC.1
MWLERSQYEPNLFHFNAIIRYLPFISLLSPCLCPPPRTDLAPTAFSTCCLHSFAPLVHARSQDSGILRCSCWQRSVQGDPPPPPPPPPLPPEG